MLNEIMNIRNAPKEEPDKKKAGGRDIRPRTKSLIMRLESVIFEERFDEEEEYSRGESFKSARSSI